MLFKIEGDLEALDPALKQFTEDIERDWKPAIVEAREKLKKMPLPIKVDLPLMEEMAIPYWKEKDHFLLRVPIMLPGGNIGMKLLGRQARKKMEKNLKGYMKEKGISVKVKHIGD